MVSGNQSNALTVEFVGLPGVGKSRIAGRLFSRLDARGIHVAQPSYDLAHGISRPRRVLLKSLAVAGQLLRDPGSLWRAFGTVRSTGQPLSAFGQFKLAFNWVLAVSLARRARTRGGVSLFDEGLFQGLWSLGLEGDLAIVEELVGRLPELASLPDCLVISRASLSTVEERVRKRADNDSRMDARLEDEPELLAKGTAALERIVARAELELVPRGLSVLEVINETDADLERGVGMLAERIEAHQRGAAQT